MRTYRRKQTKTSPWMKGFNPFGEQPTMQSMQVETQAPVTWQRKLLVAGIAVVLAYVVAEIVATALYMTTVPPSFWLREDTGPTVRFDPRSGYRLRGGPARIARFERRTDPRKATLEYVGSVSGNALGFRDRSDFAARRTEPQALRVAVLGDGYTGGDLELRWPDRAEDAAKWRSRRQDLVNLAQPGFGLGNWHRIATKILKGEEYEVDGIVIAVQGDALGRQFLMADEGDGGVQLEGRMPTWTPEEYPATRLDALRWMAPSHGHLVERGRFEQAIAGDWTPRRPFKAILASSAVDALLGMPREDAPQSAVPAGRLRADLQDATRGRGRLVREIRDAARAMEVPVLVVRIPDVDELTGGGTKADKAERALQADDLAAFVECLGAELLDGAQAFADLGEGGARCCWFSRDTYWTQDGSDRFGAWMAHELERWDARTGATDRRMVLEGDAR